MDTEVFFRPYLSSQHSDRSSKFRSYPRRTFHAQDVSLVVIDKEIRATKNSLHKYQRTLSPVSRLPVEGFSYLCGIQLTEIVKFNWDGTITTRALHTEDQSTFYPRLPIQRWPSKFVWHTSHIRYTYSNFLWHRPRNMGTVYSDRRTF
jgi:hypothetical protein